MGGNAEGRVARAPERASIGRPVDCRRQLCRTFDLRFERADTIIVLAPSRWTCTYRALRRCLIYRGRAIQSPGCPERLDLEFLLWVWRYPSQTRPLLEAALEQFGRADVLVELKTPSEVRTFLDGATT